jgi:hypothetical protein
MTESLLRAGSFFIYLRNNTQKYYSNALQYRELGQVYCQAALTTATMVLT